MLLAASRALRPLAPPRAPALAAQRGLAKKAQAGASADKPAGPPDLERVVTGLNIMKDGEDPVVKPDSEYPDWVFELHKPMATFEELVAKHEADPGSLDRREEKRLIRLWNRARIRDRNSDRS